ncbi:ABA4-like family protein [Bosea sp. 685]|uniref:ABA4-like family protein n=1 Tax=Bosea sp. 685 TaxID=3080057 RepID=UPI002892C516|nr:ABA4-like family protein [Bosea sp. 685]WNJ92528.1 ABA4-like family protein [Bosea sp. 685]
MLPGTLDDAFMLGSLLAILGWLALLLLPRWRGLSAILAGAVIPAVLSLGYFVLIAVFWSEAKGDFSSLDGIAGLFASRPLLLAGWLHYLAFDLFLGNWILRRAQEEAIPHWLMLPVLLATFLFGPIGFLAFLLLHASVKLSREDRIARTLAKLPAWLRALDFEPRLTSASLAMAALIVPTWLAYTIDARSLEAVDVWLKPLKFEASLVLYFVTLALFLPLASQAFRASWLGRYTVWPPIVAGFLEVAYIGWRASRAEASHYNTVTWLDASLYNAMGVGAVMITLASGALAYGLARRDVERIAPALRWSLVIGLASTCILGLVSGGLLGSAPGHFVGVVPAVHPTVPLFGWSLAIGDLRVAHFLGLHALQIIPAFGLLVWLLTRQARIGVAAVAAFSCFYAAVTLAALVAALQAKPLLGLG